MIEACTIGIFPIYVHGHHPISIHRPFHSAFPNSQQPDTFTLAKKHRLQILSFWLGYLRVGCFQSFFLVDKSLCRECHRQKSFENYSSINCFSCSALASSRLNLEFRVIGLADWELRVRNLDFLYPDGKGIAFSVADLGQKAMPAKHKRLDGHLYTEKKVPGNQLLAVRMFATSPS